MFRAETKAQQRRTDGLLKRQIPSYQSLLNLFTFANYDAVVKMNSLYMDLFGCSIPKLGIERELIDLLEILIRKVNQDLFPIDLDAMDTYLYETVYGGMEPELDEVPVLVNANGIDFNDVGIDGLSNAVEPIFYALLPLFREDEYYDTNAYPASQLDEAEHMWWLEHDGASQPPRFTWIYADRETINSIIEDQLEPVLQGLGALIACLLRDTGNPFFDLCPTTIIDDLYEYQIWKWEIGYLLDLQHHWNQAKDHVVKLNAYYNWFRMSRHSTKHVISALHQIEKCYKWLY